MAPKMVQVLAAGGAKHVMVVHGADGLDELSTTGPSMVYEYVSSAGEVATGDFSTYQVDPSRLGLAPAQLGDLLGGDAATNAELARRVLAGHPGPHRDVVLLNSAAALVVGRATPGLTEGVELAAEVIDSGRAAECLDRLVVASQKAAAEP